MRIKAIINPVAGKRSTQKKVRHLLERLIQEQMLDSADIYYTQADDSATAVYDEVAGLDATRYDLVLAAGGDGTLHSVVNAVLQNRKELPLAIYPAGTVNDFSIYLKSPRKVEAFVAMIKTFKRKRVDAGLRGDTYFLNVLAGGIMADVCYTVPQRLKHRFGKLAYYVASVKQIPRLFRGYHFTITYDGKETSMKGLLFIVANSNCVGGFRRVAPRACTQDGLLDLLVIGKANPFSLAFVFLKLLAGRIVNGKQLLYVQAKEISVIETNGQTVSVDMDGEHAGKTPCEIKLVPAALEVIIP